MATVHDLAENTAPDGTDRLYVTDGTNDEGVQIANLLKGSGAEVPASKITGTIAHENGGLEADVSAYDGLVKISGGATSAVTAPTGDIVGTTDTQALTNKTIDGDSNTISNLAHGAEVDNPSSGVHGVTGDVVGTTDTQTLTNKTVTNIVTDGSITEEVFAVTGTTPALSAANGTIQTWTLTGNSTPTDSISAGQSITLMVDDGSSYTITFPTITWVNNGGSAPTLATTGYTVIALWKVSTTLYGALIGDGS